MRRDPALRRSTQAGGCPRRTTRGMNGLGSPYYANRWLLSRGLASGAHHILYASSAQRARRPDGSAAEGAGGALGRSSVALSAPFVDLREHCGDGLSRLTWRPRNGWRPHVHPQPSGGRRPLPAALVVPPTLEAPVIAPRSPRLRARAGLVPGSPSTTLLGTTARHLPGPTRVRWMYCRCVGMDLIVPATWLDGAVRGWPTCTVIYLVNGGRRVIFSARLPDAPTLSGCVVTPRLRGDAAR
jgi:hypothetical protein